jgi:hypothetical protein
VPEFRPVMSSVVPEGTVMPLRVIVAHDFLEALAAAASVKVQLVARSSSLAAGVGAGAATGTGLARAIGASAPRARRTKVKECMLKDLVKMIE